MECRSCHSEFISRYEELIYKDAVVGDIAAGVVHFSQCACGYRELGYDAIQAVEYLRTEILENFYKEHKQHTISSDSTKEEGVE